MEFHQILQTHSYIYKANTNNKKLIFNIAASDLKGSRSRHLIEYI